MATFEEDCAELRRAWRDLMDALRPHWKQGVVFGVVMFVVLEAVIITAWLFGIG